MNWLEKPLKRLLATLLVALLSWGIASCSATETSSSRISRPARGALSEVSPPYTIQVLKQALELKQPQVKILSPRPNQVVGDTQVALKLQVKDLALFKDAELGLGPYLQILLDSQPYQQVYDSREPVLLENLTPGTHTIRVLAVRPWHESFKNDGAFAQTTFHVFTPTAENNPDPSQPLLTYNYPQGVYGAEPVLLDFFLTNAPLHLVAQEDPKDDIPDWKIRCTINGESFTFDRWEPIYLKGLKPGKNWVQLELLDDKDRLLPNVFNSAVQLVTYEPGGADTLARLTRGELTADAARKIVDPNYVPPAPAPVVEEIEAEEAKPAAEASPPEILEPEILEPEVLEPKVLEPEILEPKVLEPKVSAPEVLPPVEPEPAIELKPSEPEQPTSGAEPEVIAPIVAPALIKPEPNKFEPTQEPASKSSLPKVSQPAVQPARSPVPAPKEPEVSPDRLDPAQPQLKEPEAKPNRFKFNQPVGKPAEQPSSSDVIRELQPPTAPEKVIPEAGQRFQSPPNGAIEQSGNRAGEAPFFKLRPSGQSAERPGEAIPSFTKSLEPVEQPEANEFGIKPEAKQPENRPVATPATKPLLPERPEPVKLPDLERPAPPKLVPPAPPKLNNAPESNRFLQSDDGLDEQLDRPRRSLEPVKSELVRPNSFKAVEEQQNQVLQPTPVSNSPVRSLETSPGFADQPSLSPIAPAEPTSDRPDLFGMLDQVKAFFEGLKRPAPDKPLLAPLLNPLPDADAGQNLIPDAGEPTIIDTLIDALPEPLRQSVLEELEQPSSAPNASPASRG